MGELDPISYEDAKEVIRSGDVPARLALAERGDVPPEILYYLAEDGNPSVREAVAKNEAAPRQTDLLLARDDDASVRGSLAGKIASVAPNLSPQETNKVRAQTYEALEALASDQMEQVRKILAEAIKDVVDAPPDVIKTLANDISIQVSGPVLEFSPVLTEEDLVEIIEQGSADGRVAAIARREDVTENLADAIIGTDDVAGIADLLGNGSAQIREEALDELIDRSASIELWQAPLVTRPVLPDGAAQRMAGFLAENLLDALSKRADLDDAAKESVSSAVRQRISGKPAKALSAGFDFLSVETPLASAERLYRAKKLSDDVLFKALRAGDHSFVFAGLLVRSGLDEAVGRRIFEEKSPHGIVALMGKAEFPASMMGMVQQKMGRIAPSEVIEPRDGSDDIPMATDDIDWHLDFFTNLVNRG